MLPADALIVVGHRRPDLDSIAAALGYAELLRASGRPAVAARPGPLDAQSEWALDAGDVVSRKKQLIPMLLAALE